MPTIKLTQVAVDRLKAPGEGYTEYWDSQCPGFGLRVYATGRKTWRALYRVNGKLIPETLGTYSILPSVAEARERARQSLQKAQQGINPVAERRKQQMQEERRDRDTLSATIDRYLVEYAQLRMRPDYFRETKRALQVDVAAKLGSRSIRELTRREIRALLGAIVARGRAPHASHVLAYLRAMLNWAVAEELIETNPAIGVPDPDPRKRQDRERDRYLGDDEIKIFWPACDRIGWPFGPLFQLLLMTGARRDELAQATWDEFDLERRAWLLPRRRSKNDKEHVTHLSPLAMEIITALPRTGEGGFLFSTTSRTPVSGFGRARERLAAAMPGVAPFTLHDLRRSIATGMANLGVGEHVVDRVLNHAGGKVSGVARIYNRAEYLKERQEALEAWSRHIESLVRLTPSNVVELAAANR